MNTELPVYKAYINNAECGFNVVSLVEFPAVESDFIYMSAQESTEVTLQIEDEEKRIITGCVLRADYPMLRINGDYKYYIVFDRDTIELATAKWLAESSHNSIDLSHDHNRFVDGIFLMEAYIKDSKKGINPIGFEGVADGSLFATYKVLNDEVWNSIKSGDFKGFSIEGRFVFEEVENEEDVTMSEIEEMINKIKKYTKKCQN